MKNRRTKINALSISIIFHLVFVSLSAIYKLPGIITTEQVKQRIFDIKIAKESKYIPPSPSMQSFSSKALRFESPEHTDSIDSFLKEEVIKKKELDLPQEDYKELTATKAPDDLYDDRKTVDYDISKKLVFDDAKKDVKDVLKVTYEDILHKADDILTKDELMKDFADKIPGLTPKLAPKDFDMAKYKKSTYVQQKKQPVISRLLNFGKFESDLVWMMETYQDPNDNEKYFKISIRAGSETKNLPTIPKEIIFLLDCSKSIEDKRLEEFKEGIKYSLENLNEKDLFNIVVFKEIIFEFQQETVKPTKENIEKAISFVNEFQVGEKTDAFEVLEKSVKQKAKLNPSYIILLSDGRPTKGLTNPREVINKISETNNGRKPIFAFSGSSGVNRYLLDFISFKNRGWAEYSERYNLIGENFGKMYNKIDEPIIMNLRYLMSGVNENEMFPMILSDFFRNAEFTVYGKYDEEEEMVLQLLGEVKGETKEFILRGLFKEANPGDEQIAKNWAYNKIYHLIGQLKYDQDNKNLLSRIDTLAKKFQLKMPYLQDILE